MPTVSCDVDDLFLILVYSNRNKIEWVVYDLWVILLCVPPMTVILCKIIWGLWWFENYGYSYLILFIDTVYSIYLL